MPSCSIIACRNRSYPSCGIGFYRFPHNPRLREIWIEVTGRKDWMPTKNSKICSKHFVEDDFLVTKCKYRRILRSGAVPHIDVCRLVQNDIGDKQLTNNWASIVQIKDEDESNDDDEEESSNEESEDDERLSPSLSGESKKQLKRIITTKCDVIKRQASTIRRIRAQNRRFKAKIEKMENILKDLQKEMVKWLPD